MNMNLDKFFRIAFVILSLSFLWTWVMWNKTQEKTKNLIEKNSILQRRIDSLNSEIFTLEIRLFRHERAYEIFEEKNPQASSQLSDIISDETE